MAAIGTKAFQLAQIAPATPAPTIAVTPSASFVAFLMGDSSRLDDLDRFGWTACGLHPCLVKSNVTTSPGAGARLSQSGWLNVFSTSSLPSAQLRSIVERENS